MLCTTTIGYEFKQRGTHVEPFQAGTALPHPVLRPRADLKAATRHKRWRSLKTFFNWCQDEEHTRHNPIEQIPEPRGTERYPRAVRSDGLEAICKALRRDYAWQRSHQPGSVAEGEMIWCIPVFWFALCTGLRVSEPGMLRHKDVRPGEELVYVRESKRGPSRPSRSLTAPWTPIRRPVRVRLRATSSARPATTAESDRSRPGGAT